MVPDGKWGRLHAPLHLLLVISRTTWQNRPLLAESKRRLLVKKSLWFFCGEENYVPAGSFEGRNVIYGLLLSAAHARYGAPGERSPRWWSHAARAEPELTADLDTSGCPAASSCPRNECAIKRKLTAACPYRCEKPRGMSSGVWMFMGKERSIGIRAMPCTEFPQTNQRWVFGFTSSSFYRKAAFRHNRKSSKNQGQNYRKTKRTFM